MRTLLASFVLLHSLSGSWAPSTAGEPAASAEQTRPLPVGASIPPLELTSADGQPFDLNAAVAEKPTILILYRGGW